MPRYLHIPHTPDTARTLTLNGRNYLVMSDMTTTPTHDLKDTLMARWAPDKKRHVCVPLRGADILSGMSASRDD